MVLSIQWLIQLGPILWDFKLLRMEFSYNQRKIVLQGSPLPRLQMMQGKDLTKALQLPSQICSI